MLPVLVFAAFINLTTFLVFWRDKRAARNGEWRTSEATLLWLAFVGGSLGAIAAQRLLRHKTRKQPFASILLWIVLLQAAMILAAALAPQLFGASALQFLRNPLLDRN